MFGRATLQLLPLVSSGQGQARARRRALATARREDRGQDGRQAAERLTKGVVTSLLFGQEARFKVRPSGGPGGTTV